MTIQNKLFDTTNHEYTIVNTKINDVQTLNWNRELGIGFLNPPENSDEVYDEEYWNRYRSMIDTDIGRKLTQCRIDICKQFNITPLELLDIGIGNGDFVDKFKCRGYDINKMAVKYLKENKKFIDIYNEDYRWKVLSMWDVLEHVVDIKPLLDKTDMLIMSTPIYSNMEECLKSKHFRTTEHFWYFTVHGMIYYMNHFGFDCKYYSTIESKLGRFSIGSFVFKRD